VALRRLPELIGRRKVLLAGMLSMTIGMLCYWWVDAASPWLIIVPALVTGMAHGLMFHTMTALTIESFPDKVRGTGSALALMMMDLGMIAGAPVMGYTAEAFGFKWMFAAIGALMAVSAAAYTYSSVSVWRARRQQRHAIETAEAAETAAAPYAAVADESLA
jgi:MFS family permease